MKLKTWILTGISIIVLMTAGLMIWMFYQTKADTTSSGCHTAAFYSEPNFAGGGSYGCFPLGGFYTAYLNYFNLVGKISSVEIASGYKVMLFKEDNFGGSSITLTSDTANLATKNFDNAALSVRVLSANDPELGAEDEEITCDTVVVYSASNYGDMGAAWCVSVGEYSSLESDFNDSISSVKVYSGYKVTLYKDKNFTGDTLELTANVASLATKNFANMTSSLKVAKVESTTTPTDTPTTPAETTETTPETVAPTTSTDNANTAVAETPTETTPTTVTTPSSTTTATTKSTPNKLVILLVVGGIGILGLAIGVFYWIKKRPR